MKQACIVSVAFREPYVTHSRTQKERLRGFLKKIFSHKSGSLSYHKTNFTFFYFEDELPTRNGIIKENIISVFQSSLYGFKPHAIQQAINVGYEKIIWLDPSVLPVTDIQVLIDSLDKHPIIIIRGDAPLAKMTNQKAKNWFGVTDEDIKDVKHIGGTIYGFNFNNPKVVATFNLWKEAEEAGIFGIQDEFMAGHWADESCMALAMFKNGMGQYSETKFKYLNQKEL